MNKKSTIISIILLVLLIFTACSQEDPAKIYLEWREYKDNLPTTSIINAARFTTDEFVTVDMSNYTTYVNENGLKNYIQSVEKLDQEINITDISGQLYYNKTTKSEGGIYSSLFTTTTNEGFSVKELSVKYELYGPTGIQEYSFSLSADITKYSNITSRYNSSTNTNTTTTKYVNRYEYTLNGVDMQSLYEEFNNGRCSSAYFHSSNLSSFYNLNNITE